MENMNVLQIIQSVTCIVYYIIVGGIAIYGLSQYDKWKKPKQYEKYEEVFATLLNCREYLYHIFKYVIKSKVGNFNEENFEKINKLSFDLNMDITKNKILKKLYFKNMNWNEDIEKLHLQIVEVNKVFLNLHNSQVSKMEKDTYEELKIKSMGIIEEKTKECEGLIDVIYKKMESYKI